MKTNKVSSPPTRPVWNYTIPTRMNYVPRRSRARPVIDLQLCISLRPWSLLTPYFRPLRRTRLPSPTCTKLPPTKMSKITAGWFPHPLLRIQVNVDDHLQNCTTHPAGCRNHRYYTYGSWHAACTVRMANTPTGQRRQIL